MHLQSDFYMIIKRNPEREREREREREKKKNGAINTLTHR